MCLRTIRLMLLVALALQVAEALANNLGLTNLTVKPRDDNTAYVKFDLKWENSWRYTNINHDAAWVFFKVKSEGCTDWEHVTLETNGHATGTGTPIEIVVPSDRVGCFIHRANEGTGVLAATNVMLAWNFASNSLVKTDRVRIQAFAVEMVYVATGDFYVGSGGTEVNRFYAGGTTNDPCQIASEDAITVGTNAGNLYYDRTSGASHAGDLGTPVLATFPKGYAAFYCMKYEITQGQYRDFLNSLTRVQQNARTAIQSSDYFTMANSATYVKRNGIRCPSSILLAPERIVFGCDANANKIMNETNDAMDRACNYLTWADGCAFADWAGLRPFTELEYEKACRGPLAPVANEYAWGSLGLVTTTSLLNDGSGQETAVNGNYNGQASGPYRAGIYATGNSTRQLAGASYWGIMELSGNLTERPVTLGNAAGRSFTGLHGNGKLDADGNADVSLWPNTTGTRGGTYLGGGGSSRAYVSDRDGAAYTDTGRYFYFGWRGARTAPALVEP